MRLLLHTSPPTQMKKGALRFGSSDFGWVPELLFRWTGGQKLGPGVFPKGLLFCHYLCSEVQINRTVSNVPTAQIFPYTCLCLIYSSKQSNKSPHMLSVPIFDMSQGLAEKAIYSHSQLTTGTYTFMWNAIQNAENIFSSRQQTAKGTSGSSPCVRTVISGTVWTFNYCNPAHYSFRNIINQI